MFDVKYRARNRGHSSIMAVASGIKAERKEERRRVTIPLLPPLAFSALVQEPVTVASMTLVAIVFGSFHTSYDMIRNDTKHKITTGGVQG